MTTHIRIGSTTIDRIEDYLGPSLDTKFMFPAFRASIWEAERHWLAPTYMLPDGVRIRSSHHSWLVRTGRHVVLIDCCIGNHKVLNTPHFHMRDGRWLENLRAAGVSPEQIDFVLCTHLHADHVGWNTRLANGRWVPTFPNAKYLWSTAEFVRWDARRPDYTYDRFNENVFADSVLPIVEAGQMTLVEDGHALDDQLSVAAAAGHTPGHIKVRLRSQGQEGVFSGDVLHHPVQVAYPEICSSFDDDPGRALHTRLAVLEEIADRDAILMPAHFAEPHACRVVTERGRFGIRWI